MEDTFIVIWLGLGLAMMLCSVVYGAWIREPSMGDLLFYTFIVSVVWPLILAVAVVLAPFMILYFLVSWLRDLYEDRFED